MLRITDIKVGTIFQYEDALYQALSVNHSKQARGAAVLQTRIKNLITGNVLDKNFKAGDKFEEAEIMRKQVNFLYKDANKYYFMDETDYDQFFLDENILKDKTRFLTESLSIKILYFNEKAIGVELPPKVEIKVKHAPDGVRGNSTANVTKVIELESGYKINAPMFIKQGEIVRVNTETGEYVERVS
ncbi:elongation factor P [Patescibacteria group bacterium]|nr:elongation factor P [Patescibacteria group bacterium]MBU4482185.1 elongation factor P [Patescibacteria group bacterium]